PKPPRGSVSPSPPPAPKPICSAASSAASNPRDHDRGGLCPRIRHVPATPAPAQSVRFRDEKGAWGNYALGAFAVIPASTLNKTGYTCSAASKPDAKPVRAPRSSTARASRVRKKGDLDRPARV